MMKNTPCEFSVCLYSQDDECIRAFHMMQFGNIAEKGIRKLTFVDTNVFRDCEIAVLDKKALADRWDEVWAAIQEIICHLQKSPIYYSGEVFTEELYRDFFLCDETEVIAAMDHGKIVGLIEWNKEGNELLAQESNAVNVGEVFVYPSYRGTGLAHRLLSFAEESAYAHGYRYIWVEHGTANPNARGFWNKYFKTYQHELVRTIRIKNER